jgi:hypothetical protein
MMVLFNLIAAGEKKRLINSYLRGRIKDEIGYSGKKHRGSEE